MITDDLLHNGDMSMSRVGKIWQDLTVYCHHTEYNDEVDILRYWKSTRELSILHQFLKSLSEDALQIPLERNTPIPKATLSISATLLLPAFPPQPPQYPVPA